MRGQPNLDTFKIATSDKSIAAHCVILKYYSVRLEKENFDHDYVRDEICKEVESRFGKIDTLDFPKPKMNGNYNPRNDKLSFNIIFKKAESATKLKNAREFSSGNGQRSGNYNSFVVSTLKRLQITVYEYEKSRSRMKFENDFLCSIVTTRLWRTEFDVFDFISKYKFICFCINYIFQSPKDVKKAVERLEELSILLVNEQIQPRTINSLYAISI